MFARTSDVVMKRGVAPSTLALVLLACGPTTAPTDATSTPDAGLVLPATPLAPAAPMAPTAACPTGWTSSGMPTFCRPWADARPTCSAMERLAPGGCVALASDCADVPPEVASGAAYVVPDSTGGDGSLAHPFGTIDEALTSGATSIALGPGHHTISTRIDGVSISGSCPDRTQLETASAVTLGEVTLQRLTITGAGVVGETGHTLTITHAEITTLANGLVVHGSLSMREVAMRESPVGVVGDGASAITIEDVAFERVFGTVLEVSSDASRTNVDVHRVVLASIPSADAHTFAIHIDGARAVTLEEIAIDEITNVGFGIDAASTTIHAIGVYGAGGGLGYLLDDYSETPIVLGGLWSDDVEAGMAFGVGTYQVSDVFVRASRYIGIVLVGAHGTFDRVRIEGARGMAVDVADRCDVMFDDLVVTGVVHVGGTDNGGGVLVEANGVLHLERASLGDTEHYGLGIVDGAQAFATDLEIGTVHPLVPQDGFGVLVQLGSGTIERVRIHDVFTAALGVQAGTVSATDLVVRQVSTNDDTNGSGIVASVEDGDPASTITLTRADIGDVVRWGVIATGAGARIVASDIDVHDVHAAPCCEGARGGAAFVVHDGASASITRFWAHDAVLAGIVATEGITATFDDGLLQENGIGMVVSPTLPVNTESMPGIEVHHVAYVSNLVDQQVTDTSVAAPSLVLR